VLDKPAIKFSLPVLFMFSLTGLNCSAVRNINIYTTAEEVQIGNSLDKEIRKEYDILKDDKIDSFLAERGKKLVQASGRSDIEYNFALVNSEVINAFAIPGGYCYVNLGLFRQSETEAELISVLAHEINHVVHRHSMKRLSQMQLAGAITQIALGNAGDLQYAVANLFTSTGMLYYSREAEREADRDGLLTMYRAGYDPQGMVDMFEKLKANREGPEPGGWQLLFSTHPITGERIENTKKEIAGLPSKPDLIMNSPEWSQIRKYLQEKYPPPKKSEKKAGEGKGGN